MNRLTVPRSRGSQRMSWLESQENDLLRDWLRRTNTPLIAALPAGDILWCNAAFEELLGWSHFELVDRMSWHDITVDPSELQADKSLVEETMRGERMDYQMQKSYRTKNGAPKRVVIDVLRFPATGKFDCFLVSVFPVDKSVDYAMGQLTQIRQLIIELMARQPNGLTVDKTLQFTKDHPVASAVIGTVLGVLLFGERVVEIVRMISGGGS